MNHDVWKSKRFIGAFVATLLSLVGLLMEAYSDVKIENPEVLVQAIVFVWGVAIGGYALEDVVVAAKSGARADKYQSPD